MAAKEFVCSLQYGCDWVRVLGFGLGVVAGLSFVLVLQLTYAWTAWLLKRAVGRATEWGSLAATIVGGLVAYGWVTLPIVPAGLTADRKAYVAAVVWGLLAGLVFERLRERWRS